MSLLNITLKFINLLDITSIEKGSRSRALPELSPRPSISNGNLLLLT